MAEQIWSLLNSADRLSDRCFVFFAERVSHGFFELDERDRGFMGSRVDGHYESKEFLRSLETWTHPDYNLV